MPVAAIDAKREGQGRFPYMARWPIVPVLCLAVWVCAASARAQERAVTLESLLGEMTDYGAVARWPDPPYTCRQASSYDRRSKTPDDPGGWFANTDNMDGSGDSLRWETIAGTSAVPKETKFCTCGMCGLRRLTVSTNSGPTKRVLHSE